jgi:hypothetical protein
MHSLDKSRVYWYDLAESSNVAFEGVGNISQNDLNDFFLMHAFLKLHNISPNICALSKRIPEIHRKLHPLGKSPGGQY